ncbi:hypothetical protein EDF77_1926 [Stenotrophomonas maltophilia]|uniref:head-tail joining protein n=1 Tax=Stenotrophomonas chelatiphaga TaxID=517011 RepID=UPI000F4BBFF0|nr:hypothetical protein [Stenotrophomonas chelatiphaga]MCS4231362.1 hypothetical protein [Stenotrophomonas chelatiphaga]ROQ42451.1 hypothetical protein EDF77_1926 [Stenotrophomonas maltophilia]
MNQRAFLQGIDAMMFAAFRGAGIANGATYQHSGTAPVAVPCTVLHDEGVQDFDDDGVAVSTPYNRVTLQLAEVSPRSGGVVQIAATGRRLKLEQKIRGDESSQVWEVSNA